MRKLIRIGISAGAAAAAVALAIVPAQGAAAATVRVVTPGQSIQAAVDAASPGDTISVAAGTYHESITITKDNITLRGAGSGAGGTVLAPPATFPANFCARVPPDAATHGGGVCILGQFTFNPEAVQAYVTGVHVTGIKFDGFPGDGVAMVAAKNSRADHLVINGSGGYGLVDVASVQDTIDHITINGGTRAGIYENSSGAVLAANDVSNAAYGIAVQDSDNFVVTGNNAHGNCNGYMVFDSDEANPAGDNSVVAGNVFSANNAFCHDEPSIDFPAIQGTGMVLVGATHTVITGNTISGNTGAQPLSGGIALVSGAPYLAGPVESSVVITGNTVTGNGPTDLMWDGAGSAVVISGNHCGTSSPASLCA